MSWRHNRQPRERRRRVTQTSYSAKAYRAFLETHQPKYVIGIDEVAFGSFAGPLVVGAVVLPTEMVLEVQDSKRYGSRKKLEAAAQLVEAEATSGIIKTVPVEELNAKGLGDSLQEAFATVASWAAQSCEDAVVVLDGKNKIKGFTDCPQLAIPGADGFVCAVSSASVCAKTAQLDCMDELDELYPQYGFHRNHGYGTAAHRAALREHGVSPTHRTYISYIQKILAKQDAK